MACATCRYRATVKRGHECRAHPPVVAKTGVPHIPYARHFPPVQLDDWCGEYEAVVMGGGDGGAGQ